MKMGVKMTGVARTLQHIKDVKRQDLKSVEDGMFECARIILEKSNEYVPVDTTALKKSGRVEISGFGGATGGGRPTAEVVYGGGSVHYALYVHEDLTKYHAAPTCAKFLERAARETKQRCSKVMRDAIQQRTKFTKGGREVS